MLLLLQGGEICIYPSLRFWFLISVLCRLLCLSRITGTMRPPQGCYLCIVIMLFVTLMKLEKSPLIDITVY